MTTVQAKKIYIYIDGNQIKFHQNDESQPLSEEMHVLLAVIKLNNVNMAKSNHCPTLREKTMFDINWQRASKIQSEKVEMSPLSDHTLWKKSYCKTSITKVPLITSGQITQGYTFIYDHDRKGTAR